MTGGNGCKRRHTSTSPAAKPSLSTNASNYQKKTIYIITEMSDAVGGEISVNIRLSDEFSFCSRAAKRCRGRDRLPGRSSDQRMPRDEAAVSVERRGQRCLAELHSYSERVHVKAALR